MIWVVYWFGKSDHYNRLVVIYFILINDDLSIPMNWNSSRLRTEQTHWFFFLYRRSISSCYLFSFHSHCRSISSCYLLSFHCHCYIFLTLFSFVKCHLHANALLTELNKRCRKWWTTNQIIIVLVYLSPSCFPLFFALIIVYTNENFLNVYSQPL